MNGFIFVFTHIGFVKSLHYKNIVIATQPLSCAALSWHLLELCVCSSHLIKHLWLTRVVYFYLSVLELHGTNREIVGDGCVCKY